MRTKSPSKAPTPVPDRRKSPRRAPDRRQSLSPTVAQLYASSFIPADNERRADLLARQNEARQQTRIWRQIMALCSGSRP